MPNQVSDVHVRRVSFVKRASTRDPARPTEPRRLLLYKAEGASDAATVTPPAPYVETATDRKARRLSKACDLMHEEIETMRGNGTPGAVIRAHEQAYGRLHTELVALHDPVAARRLRDNDASTERTTTMPADLVKRAIGTDGAKPAAGDGLLTLQEIEDRQEHYAGLLSGLESDMRKMRRDGTPLHVLQRHENAHRNLAEAYKDLDAQRGLAERVAPMVKAEDSPIAKAEAALRRADPSLTGTQALAAAIRACPDAYYAEGGIRRGGSGATASALAKAAGDTSYAEHGASVQARAAVLEKSQSLSPTRAYALALSESGVLAVA